MYDAYPPAKKIAIAVAVVVVVIAMHYGLRKTPESMISFRKVHVWPSQYARSSSGGVTVHGYTNNHWTTEPNGWIVNNNDFPVKVKRVWVARSETTQWIKELGPGEKMHELIYRQHRFYIYNTEGGEIGFIYPRPNGLDYADIPALEAKTREEFANEHSL